MVFLFRPAVGRITYLQSAFNTLPPSKVVIPFRAVLIECLVVVVVVDAGDEDEKR